MKINFLGSTLSALSLFTVLCAVPLFFYEYIIRKRGTSLLVSLKSVYQEIVSEIEVNNAITKRHTFHSHKAPVLLLYGFFSSRRTLSVIEKNLVEQGFDVLSFNLGGLFNTFFTRSVTETAAFLDYKLKRHREKHGWQKIQIVAHSKGGLVAAHWLLNGGGAIYCNKLITLSTPFSGSYHTYLAIPTPLGLFWKDVWQMRPGSSFLRNLQNAEKPSSPLKIVCFYSDEDKISRGERATFQPFWPVSDLMTIETVEFKGLAHFDFLFKKSVVQKIVQYLDKDEDVIKEVVGKQNEPDKVLKKAT